MCLRTFDKVNEVAMSIFIQGCTVGRHNPVKPAEPEKVKEKPLAVGEVRERTHTQLGCLGYPLIDH